MVIKVKRNSKVSVSKGTLCINEIIDAMQVDRLEYTTEQGPLCDKSSMLVCEM